MITIKRNNNQQQPTNPTKPLTTDVIARDTRMINLVRKHRAELGNLYRQIIKEYKNEESR